MATLSSTGRFAAGETCADNDILYGPYATVAAAHAALLNAEQNVVGRTVGIQTGNTIEEYWYQGGTTETHLIKKETDTTQLEQTVDGINENYLKAGQSSGSSSVTDFDIFADTVHNKEQILSSTQKAQVRQNINAQEQIVGATATPLPSGSSPTVDMSNGVLQLGIPVGADAVNPFKGYFNSLSDLQAKYPTGETGDFANVYDLTADKTYRYIWDASLSTPAWTQALDSSSQPIEVTPSTATFATGQSVIDTSIVTDLATGGANNVASAETVKVLNGIATPKANKTSGTNLINKDDPANLAGYTINGTTGELIQASTSPENYYITDYIPINGNNIQYSCYSDAFHGSANVYDDKLSLVRTLGQVSSYTHQSGEAFIRFSCSKNNLQTRANYGNTLLSFKKWYPNMEVENLNESQTNLESNDFVGGFDVTNANGSFGHVLGSHYIKVYSNPTAANSYDFISNLFTVGKKVRIILTTQNVSTRIFFKENGSWVNTVIAQYSDAFDVIISLPRTIEGIRLYNADGVSLNSCCYLLSDLEQSIAMEDNLDGTDLISINNMQMVVSSKDISDKVKELLGLRIKLYDETNTTSNTEYHPSADVLKTGTKLEFIRETNLNNTVVIFGYKADSSYTELGRIYSDTDKLNVTLDADYSYIKLYTSPAQTYKISIYNVYDAVLPNEVEDISRVTEILYDSNVKYYEESVTLPPDSNNTAQYNLYTFPKEFTSGDYLKIELSIENSYQYFVIYQDNSYQRITNPTVLEQFIFNDVSKTFKNLRIVTGPRTESVTFTVKVTIVPQQYGDVINTIVGSNNFKINMLVIGNSYSVYAPRWITPFMDEFPAGSSVISLGVGSATVKDRYADRETYPYTDRPVQANTTGNLNTYACQIEKLKRLMTGTDLDEGETQLYTNPSDYPNVIIIQGGENDSPDSDEKEALYINQFLKQLNNVYVKSNTETAILTNCIVKTPLSEIDRTSYAGAYRYLIDSLSELFPNAQIFITSKSNLYYWNGTIDKLEKGMKIRNQQSKVATLAGVNFIDWMGNAQISTINNWAAGSGTQEDPYVFNKASNDSYSKDTDDMLHPNIRGGKKLGKLAAMFVKQNYLGISNM